MPKIQMRRGAKSGLPNLSPGEFGLVTDVPELYIGGSQGNIEVPTIESGTWTPIIGSWNVDGNCTYTERSGAYYRVGKLCYAYARIGFRSLTNTSTSDAVILRNLPFASAYGTGIGAPATVSYSTTATNMYFYFNIYANSTAAQLMRGFNNSFTSVTRGDLPASSTVYIYAFFVYITT